MVYTLSLRVVLMYHNCTTLIHSISGFSAQDLHLATSALLV